MYFKVTETRVFEAKGVEAMNAHLDSCLTEQGQKTVVEIINDNDMEYLTSYLEIDTIEVR